MYTIFILFYLRRIKTFCISHKTCYNMKYTSRERNFIFGDKLENRIKELRKEKGLTQLQLADAVGVSTRTIISLEKGQYNPSIMLAYKIARLFHTTIEELYCLEANLENEMENL